jgi:hypothetical protein
MDCTRISDKGITKHIHNFAEGDNTKMDFREINCEDVNWIEVEEDRVQKVAVVLA